ncbi:MAG: hypothetical protein AAFU85_34300, partial [Planctomycetota bacterium]
SPDAKPILRGLESLEILELYEYTDASTSLLPEWEQLTGIFLHDAQFMSQRSIEHLCECSNVRRIKFWRTDMSEIDFKPLKVLPNLVWLELMNVNVSRETVSELAEQLPNCDIMHSPEKDVQSLVWSEGGTIETEKRERRKTKHFTHYYELQINSIELRDVPKLRDDHFVPYQHLQHLDSLVVEGAPINGSTLDHIKHLAMLKQLSLCQTDVDDRIVPVLMQFKQLQELDLRKTRTSARSMNVVGQMRHLKVLRLSGKHVTSETVKMFASLSELDRLELSEASDQTITLICGLPKLTGLLLDDSYGITDESVVRLSRMKQLKHLTVAKTNITPAGFEMLAKSLPNCEIKAR